VWLATEEGDGGAADAARRAASRAALDGVNRALVDAFERLLAGLSAGDLEPDPEVADGVVAEIRGAVAAVRAPGADGGAV
jgi:hypothetical protein